MADDLIERIYNGIGDIGTNLDSDDGLTRKELIEETIAAIAQENPNVNANQLRLVLKGEFDRTFGARGYVLSIELGAYKAALISGELIRGYLD